MSKNAGTRRPMVHRQTPHSDQPPGMASRSIRVKGRDGGAFPPLADGVGTPEDPVSPLPDLNWWL